MPFRLRVDSDIFAHIRSYVDAHGLNEKGFTAREVVDGCDYPHKRSVESFIRIKALKPTIYFRRVKRNGIYFYFILDEWMEKK